MTIQPTNSPPPRQSPPSAGKPRRPAEAPDGPFFHCLHDAGSTLEKGFLSDPAFETLMNRLIGPPLLPGNSIRPLLNGDEFFPAILDLIRQAQRSICIETYMWSSGNISDQFIEVLTERAQAGVRVHVLSDGFGALRMKHDDMNRLKEGGVEFAIYERARWHRIKSNLAHRTHRKIILIDGRIGMGGGFCIDDRWEGDGTAKDKWRDNAYLFEGPVVGQIQAVFVDNWAETTSAILAGSDYFPDLEKRGEMKAQFYHGAPSDRYGTVRTSLFMAIAAAEEHIRIANAYFIPDDEAIQLLAGARQRGVRVEVIVPAISDTAIGRSASRARWQPLLEAGVEIYRFHAAMLHCKYMIADDCWCIAGSANFDSRSFSANDESNFNISDRDFARAHIGIFERDKKQSHPYTLADHRNRPIPVKAGDLFTGLFWRFL